jgi:hypothetical protein
MLRNSHSAGPLFYNLILVMFVMFGLWFVLSVAGVTRNVESAIAAWLPAWSVLANLILIPFLTLIAVGSFEVSPCVRLAFVGLMLISVVIMEICFRRFVWLSTAVLGVLLVEAYWIIPRWRVMHNSGRRQRTSS